MTGKLQQLARYLTLTVSTALFVALAACGGGSSSGTAPSAIGAYPAPTLQLNLSASRGAVDQAVTLAWTSSNSTSCSASDSWAGQQSTSGSVQIKKSDGGKFKYTLVCIGNGGSATKSVDLIVPMRVWPTSYENKNRTGQATMNLPTVWDPSMDGIRKAMEATEQGFNPRSMSMADFFQEGTNSLFVVSSRYAALFPGNNPFKWPDSPGKVYFLRMSADGSWRDDSSQLISNPAERMACITSSYSIVADFNGDGRPDVYVACTGIDFTINGVWTDDQKSDQILFLSQPDGRYTRRVVTELGQLYGHQATAADIDGDGKVDLITVDPLINRQPLVAWGRGDGTFVIDRARFPDEVRGKNIYGALALPVNGQLRYVLSGFDDSAIAGGCQGNCFGTKLYSFEAGQFRVERDLTTNIPRSFTGLRFGLGLDHIYFNGALYSFHVNEKYSEDMVIKTDLATGNVAEVYRQQTAVQGSSLVLINITPDGFLENYGASCNRNVTATPSACAVRVKVN